MLVDLIIWSRNSFSSWRIVFTATWEKTLYLYKLECWPLIPKCWDIASTRWGRDAKTKAKRDIDIVYRIWINLCHRNLDIEKFDLKHWNPSYIDGELPKSKCKHNVTNILLEWQITSKGNRLDIKHPKSITCEDQWMKMSLGLFIKKKKS